MDTKRRLALAVSVLTIGLGAGHLVQTYSATADENAAGTSDTPGLTEDPAVTEGSVQQLAGDLKSSEADPFSALPSPGKVPAPVGAALSPGLNTSILDTLSSSTASATMSDLLNTAPAAVPSGITCPVSLDLLADSNAIIGITLVSSCRPGQRVMVKHAGLAISARTSISGSLFLNLPALTPDATVEVDFQDGAEATATVSVPEVSALQRFAVQWSNDDSFQLQAFENGADYGQPGHVSAQSTHTPVAGLKAQDGFLSVLGDSSVALPVLAEVYTFPVKGSAEVLLESSVSEETCGRELIGETITSIGGKVTVDELTLAMPDCDAVGDIVVLKNLVPEMKLAAR